MDKEEIQNKIKTLEKVLETLTKVKDELGENQFVNLISNIDSELLWYRNKLNVMKNKLDFSDLVGRYFIYNECCDFIQYVHIIKVTSSDNKQVICDKFSEHSSLLPLPGAVEFHVHKHIAVSYFNLDYFKEITKEEFFNEYHKICDNFLKDKEND